MRRSWLICASGARPNSGSRLRAAPSMLHAPTQSSPPISRLLLPSPLFWEELYGRRPLRVAMGATLPVAELFQRLSVYTVFFSFATADEELSRAG